jgi:hypothetical protein
MWRRGQKALPADHAAARISLACAVTLLAAVAVFSVIVWRADELAAGWHLSHIVRSWLVP